MKRRISFLAIALAVMLLSVSVGEAVYAAESLPAEELTEETRVVEESAEGELTVEKSEEEEAAAEKSEEEELTAEKSEEEEAAAEGSEDKEPAEEESEEEELAAEESVAEESAAEVLTEEDPASEEIEEVAIGDTYTSEAVNAGLNKEAEKSDDTDTTQAVSGPFLVQYYDTAGSIVVFTETYEEGDSVDLSKRIEGEDQIGWSLTKGGTAIDGYVMSTEDVSLYPVLKETVTYKVRFYQEAVSGETYDLAESVTVEAQAGDTVSAESVQNSDNGKSYTGFTYNGERSSADMQVEEGGSTTVEVYFDRNEYTLSFDIKGNRREVADLYYSNMKLNIGDKTYTEEDGYSFTAKYGEDISDLFPTKDNVYDNPWLSTQYSDYFAGWITPSGSLVSAASTLDETLVSQDLGDGATIELTAKWEKPSGSSSGAKVDIYYHMYMEDIDSPGQYTLADTITRNVVASEATKVVIDGYEGFTYNKDKLKQYNEKSYQQYWYSSTIKYYEDNDLYWDRNAYPLNYVVKGETVKKEEVDYNKELTSYAGYVPEKISPRAVFEGWFDENGEEFDFSQKMGAEEVNVYAKWSYEPISGYTVAYDANGGEGEADKICAADGVKIRIASEDVFSKKGFTFLEWNTKEDGSGEAVEPASLYTVSADVTFYAIWEENEYTISYDPNGGTWSDGTTGVKTQVAGVTTAATVMEAPVREGYTFVKWKGSSYQPGDTYAEMEDGLYIDDELVAVWKQNAAEEDNDDKTEDTKTDDTDNIVTDDTKDVVKDTTKDSTETSSTSDTASDSSDDNSTSSSKSTKDSSNTGDSSQVTMFSLTLIIAAAGLAAVIFGRKQRN